MKENKTTKGIRLILIFGSIIVISMLFIASSANQKETSYKPVDGVLNLSDWNSEMGKPSMIGEWEFYWNQLLNYQDFSIGAAKNMQMVHVPNTWDAYEVEGEKLPGFGYATYRLKVILDQPHEELSLRLDTISTAYRIFVNDNEIASNGIVGVDQHTAKPQYQPMVVDFTTPAEEFDIIVQVSNFTYARGGIWYEINLGTHKQIAALNSLIIYKDALLIGSLLIMALYYASFYFVLQRDKSSKYFMILCLIFITRTSIYGDMLLSRIFPEIPFDSLVFLTYCTLYWITVVIYLMVDSIYENNSKVNYKKIFLIYGLAATILTAILPVHVYTQWITWIEIIGTSMVVLSLSIVIKAYIKNQKGAGLILLAVFAILVTGMHDVLYQENVIYNSFGELAAMGIFLFMFTFSFIIASRFSNAFDQARNLSLQLADSLEKEKESAKELIATELAFLKAQIKPHFIYNSLSVITALSTKDPQRTKKLLYDLSNYLRGSFNFENYNGVIPIEDELATIKAYLSIEKERFQGKLNVVYDIDETIERAIPLLTVQPLVENALRHGILKKSEGGTVWLSIQKESAGTVIQVRDDGVGMSNEKIEDIFSGTGAVTGVGLKNIHRRLHLHYGRGLEIASIKGHGTTVTIMIPEHEEKD